MANALAISLSTHQLVSEFSEQQIPGAETEAALHLSAFADFCDKSAEDTNRLASGDESKAAKARIEADRINVRYSPGVGGGFIGMEKSLDWSVKQGYIQESKRFLAKAAALRSRAADLTFMAETCRSTIQTLGERSNADPI